MFVELHLLQNFAPSNLNRDDTGAPKDCEFGGYRRARISSQCLKRAIRTTFREVGLFQEEDLARRTKRLVEAISARLEAAGRAAEASRLVAEAALAASGLDIDGDGKTEYLLYLPLRAIEATASICDQHWDPLLAAGSELREKESQAVRKKERRPSKAERQKTAQARITNDVRSAVDSALNGGRAVDLSLFGRMLADRPEKNVDAAAQVAHAISTNRVSVEFDFYTAVDDLKPEDTPGADMLGTVEFNSACFYRYANVDVEQLRRNLLGKDPERASAEELSSAEDLTHQTVEGFLRASVAAIPTGKQNSMAAQNPPSFGLAVVRKRGLWSLANAFVRPVFPDAQADLMEKSIQALDAYWGQLATVYGENNIVDRSCCSLGSNGLTALAASRVATFDALVGQAMQAITFDPISAAGRP